MQRRLASGDVALRALLFDLDDTLIPEGPALEAGFAAVAERVWGASTPVRVQRLRTAARHRWLSGAPAGYRERVHLSLSEGLHGDLIATGEEADAMRAFLPRLHAEAFEDVLPPAARGRSGELVDVWRAARIGALTRFEETLDVLSDLGARMPLALVTNGAARLQRCKLDVTGIREHFPVIVDSETVGIGKPDPAMFETALRALGVQRDQAVMIGNDRGRDVAGALAAGMRPIWVRRDAAPMPGAEIAQISDLRQLRERLPGW